MNYNNTKHLFVGTPIETYETELYDCRQGKTVKAKIRLYHGNIEVFDVENFSGYFHFSSVYDFTLIFAFANSEDENIFLWCCLRLYIFYEKQKKLNKLQRIIKAIFKI